MRKNSTLKEIHNPNYPNTSFASISIFGLPPYWLHRFCSRGGYERDRLTCLLRNLYAGQEATIRNGMEQTGCNQERSTSRLYIVTLLI